MYSIHCIETINNAVGTKFILGGLPIAFLLIHYTVIKETYYNLTSIGGSSNKDSL